MRLNVELKKNVYEEFVEYCGEEGRSISEVIRYMVTNWNAKKRREKLQLLKMQSVHEEDGNDGKSDSVG